MIGDQWASHMVEDADVDKVTHDRASFYLRQLSGALSPSNFLLTNPELLRTTWAAEAENLARGMKMLAEDIEAGGGNLKIRQTNNDQFVLGVNMATTPGKVVFRNDLIELLQYAPTTEKVYRRPLLIVPPWINKFYILDLNPGKSFIRWAVSQGLTVFCVSWVNPGAPTRRQGFLRLYEGWAFRGAGEIEQITGERQVTSIGYCVGGTLTAATLAYMAAKGDDRIAAATFFTTQVDFSDPGDLKIFADEDRIKNIESRNADVRLSRQQLDGQYVQHAAAERNDLVLCRQQLPEGRRADGLRPAGVEQRFHPHAARQSFLLPAQLLSQQPARQEEDAARRRHPRPRQGQDPGL